MPEQKTYTSSWSGLIDAGCAQVAQRPEFASGDKVRQHEGVSAEHVDHTRAPAGALYSDPYERARRGGEASPSSG